MIKFPQMVRSFMISTNKNSKNWGHELSRIILGERTHSPVFLWNRHTVQILLVSKSLEVSTYQQNVNLHIMTILNFFNSTINGLELSMCAALHSNLKCRHFDQEPSPASGGGWAAQVLCTEKAAEEEEQYLDIHLSCSSYLQHRNYFQTMIRRIWAAGYGLIGP